MFRSSRKRRDPITLFPISKDSEPVSKRTRSQRLKSHKFDQIERFPIPVDKKIQCGESLDFNKDVWKCFGYVCEEPRDKGYPYRAIYLHIIDNVKFRHTPIVKGMPMEPFKTYPASPGSPTESDEDPCPYRHTSRYDQVCRELKYYARELNLFDKHDVKGYKTPKELCKVGNKQWWGPHITIPVDSRHDFPVGDRVTINVKPRLVFKHVKSIREWVMMIVDDKRLPNGHLSIAEYIEPFMIGY